MFMKRITAIVILVCMLISLLQGVTVFAALSNNLYDETGKEYTVSNYGVLGSGETKSLSFVCGSQTSDLATDTGIVISELSSTTVNRTSPLQGAYLKGNAVLTDGSEIYIDVPIYGVRRNGAGTLLCVEVLISDLPEGAPQASESYKASKYTIYSRDLPMNTYDFPKGTMFITAASLENEPGDWSIEKYDGYSFYYKGQNGTTDGPYEYFKSNIAGSYKLWALVKKQNDDVSRNSVVLIDGKTAVFNEKVAEPDMKYRWEKDSENNVILLKRGEEFTVRLMSKSSEWGRLAALALVPATYEIPENSALSGTVIYDEKYQFSMNEMLKNQNECFERLDKSNESDVTVTINGTEVEVKANAASLAGVDVNEVDTHNNKIFYPTVADALICAEVVKVSDFISGNPKATRVIVDGKIASKCDTMQLYGGEEITTVAIDNTNFEPVNYGILSPAEGTYASFLKLSPNIDSMLSTELSFAVNDDGTLKTGADGLKGCYLNGYVETNKTLKGVTKDGVSYTVPEGSKVYFCNVKIADCVNPKGQKPGIIPDSSQISHSKYTDSTGYGDYAIKLEDGTYIPHPFTYLFDSGYNTSHLYITNKNTGNELYVEEQDGKYVIWSESYKFVYAIKATYSGDRLEEIEQIGDFVSVGSPLVIDVKENQKAFLWDNSVTLGDINGVTEAGGTKMIPISDALEYAGSTEVENQINYPEYAKLLFEETETATIENGSNKLVFYKGKSKEGQNLVQSEIYTKKSDGTWIKTKTREEDFGFLMMSATDAEYLSGRNDGMLINIKKQIGNITYSEGTFDFYKMGNGTWLIPTSFEVISDKKIKLNFENQNKVNFSAVYEFDDFADDAKVTINAGFNQKGAYSFMFFNGDGVEYEEYDTVTAPFLYIKHAVPENAILINEPLLFTPMNTLHFPKNGVKAEGEEITLGVAVDPTSVEQGYPLMKTSKFAAMFRTPDNKVRSHIVAPVMGNPASKFEEGEEFTFSVRLLNRTEGWYDTFKHVAQDLFNCTDLRTNYYGSVNDTIYNVSDLMMDDYYGGWDNEWFGWYNMEAKNCVSQSNYLSAYQNYLITDDREIAEERVVPTIAYMLSRGKAHYIPEDDVITDSYGAARSPLSGMASQVGTVYGGLYEMSQGRMPYLLDHALTKSGKNIFDYIALYKYTENETYLEEVISAADSYLSTYPNSVSGRETPLVNGFVYGDYIHMLTTLLAAYEVTGENEYLEKAEECGRLLMAVVWTTDYQNDYAEKDYYVDPIKEAERPIHFDVARYNFWWHGGEKFRPGNPIGEAQGIVKLTESGSAILDEETVPGWLLAKAGLGTEHASTPGNNNVITMNNWLGAMVRLSEYTGDSFFETQARNAIIGRYQNYPGYYLDRYSTQYYKKDYPYKGPDISGIYWHHIPIFSTMVQDFLINEAWAKSNKKIDFPYIYQRGYAYFDSYQFGHMPGKFYTESDMWLWLDRDILTSDNVNVDYVAARKDGVFAVALMNEANEDITTTITLGSKVGSSISKNAILYEQNGKRSIITVEDNKFTVTIPAKGIKSVLLSGLTDVKAPSYAKNYTYSNQVYNTMTAHKNGYGYVIQVNDDNYYAYVYISDQSDTVPKATLTYTVGGVTKTLVDEKLNHEWLIKVDDPTKAFTYTIDAQNSDGTVTNYGGGLLEPLSKTAADGNTSFVGIDETLSSSPVYFDEEASTQNNISFEPFEVKITSHGASGAHFRLVCQDEEQFKSIVGTDFSKLIGLKLKGTFTSAKTGATVYVEQYISGIDSTSGGSLVLLMKQTTNLSAKQFSNHLSGKFNLTLYPQNK